MTYAGLAYEVVIDSYEKLTDLFIFVSADSDFTKPLMHLLFQQGKHFDYSLHKEVKEALNNINDKR